MSALLQPRAPFPWYGGKHQLASTIVELLPPHLVYVEAFGGAASVLLAKGHSRLEIYNDVDDGLVTFFRALRDHPEELERRLRLTPFSRSEFRHCLETWRDVADDIERARRWYVRVEQAFCGSSRTVGWGGERLGRRRGSRARTSLRRLDRLEAIALRLRSVQIEALDWREVLGKYDSADACFYLDPPYHPDTRARWYDGGGAGYVHEMSAEDHAELVDRVCVVQASVVLSGYEHESYAPLAAAGFERYSYEVLCRASNRSRRPTEIRTREEVVWRRVNHEERLW